MRTYHGYLRNEPPVTFKQQVEIVQSAFNHLDAMDQHRVNDNVEALCGAIKDVGPQMAMEILAALGKLMVQNEQRGQTNGRAK